MDASEAPIVLPLPPRSAEPAQPDFTAWVQPHWPAMATLARRMSSAHDWEDILQDSLAAAWRKRGQFDGDRGSARNWLLAITADQARKRLRRLRSVTSLLSDDIPDGKTVQSDIDLERALARLSRRQRLAVTLHYFIGLPVADTAVVMACSMGTVKSTLSDARARLRKDLGADYQ